MWGVPVGDAVHAAVAVAAEFGMPVEDPVVLADGSTVLVGLRLAGRVVVGGGGPAKPSWLRRRSAVVARVASLTAEVRPNVADWLTRDLAVSAYLGERGRPVVPPAGELPPGPHHHNGIALAYFGYVPHDPAVHPSPAEFAAAVGDLHAALAGYPGELPDEGPLKDVRRALTRLSGVLDEDTLAVLGAEAERLGERMRALPVRPLHGDAHPGNLLASPDGLVWNDFEDTWRGPLAWDLACVANTSLLDGAAALEAYPEECPAEDIELCLEFRRLYGVGWRFILAQRFPEVAEEAGRYLDAWLTR